MYLTKPRNKILSIGRTSYIMLALFHYATHPLYPYLNRNCTLYFSNHRKKKKKTQKSAMIHMQALQSCGRTCKLQAIENLA